MSKTPKSMKRFNNKMPHSIISMHLEMAWQGAKQNDADCEFIIGAACFHEVLYTRLLDMLHEETNVGKFFIEIGMSECSQQLMPEYWFKRSVQHGHGTGASKFAARILDPNVSDQDKEKNMLDFPNFMSDIFERSSYFQNL